MTKKIFLIAEIGQAHNGSFKEALSYIDALAKTGVNAVKFQVHIAEAESSIHEPFRVKLNSHDKTRFDYWKRMEFSIDEWKAIKKRCDEYNLEFMASPFSNAAVDLLENVGIKRYKVGSGEVNNFLLLDKIARTNKPIIISSGMSSFKELEESVRFLKSKEVSFSILQCTTSYPTQPENYGLNVIEELKERFQVPIGFSDHSAKISTSIAAVAMGAEILEFHAVFSRENLGPDASSSLEMDEIRSLVQAVRSLELALANPVNKNENSNFLELKSIFEKSLSVNKNLSAGHILTFEDLEAKKPKGYGIDAFRYREVLGKSINIQLKKWDFLLDEYIDS